MASLCNREAIVFLSCGFFFYLLLLPLQIGCLPYFHTRCGASANLGCRPETCCTWLAGNAGRKKSPKIRHLSTIAQICRAISSQLRHMLAIGMLNSNMSSTCAHNMVNFGSLTAEICWRVWGTPANFNGFHVLAALLHGTLVVGSARLCGVEQRATPIFGRAAITLGIGPHSSFVL